MLEEILKQLESDLSSVDVRLGDLEDREKLSYFEREQIVLHMCHIRATMLLVRQMDRIACALEVKIYGA